MKNRLLLLTALLILSTLALSACNGDTGTPLTTPEPAQTVNGTEPEVTAENQKPILSPEDMLTLDEINSVKQNNEYTTTDALVYDITFVSGGLSMNAALVLPADYAEKNCPTMLYFPDVGHTPDVLATNYAAKDVIVFRLWGRGRDGNEGVRDMGGEDAADAETLLEISRSCDFLSRGGIFAAGSSEGSIRALRLAQLHSDALAGCAVVDCISDLAAFGEARGEAIQQLSSYLVGGTPEELPDEYKKRSAVFFADQITTSVLILAYENSPLAPMEQATALKEALDSVGTECRLEKLPKLSSDFSRDALQILLPWIREHAPSAQN